MDASPASPLPRTPPPDRRRLSALRRDLRGGLRRDLRGRRGGGPLARDAARVLGVCPGRARLQGAGGELPRGGAVPGGERGAGGGGERGGVPRREPDRLVRGAARLLRLPLGEPRRGEEPERARVARAREQDRVELGPRRRRLPGGEP